jgi:hypothetical protein
LFSDDLSSTVAGTNLSAAPVFTSSAGSVTTSFVGSTLTGTAVGLAGGASVTVTYSATVKPQAALISGNVTVIANTVVASGTVPSCPVAADCTTTNPLTPIISVAKSVTSTTQNADGTWTVVYLVTVTNGASVPAFYDLTDTLAFGPGITPSLGATPVIGNGSKSGPIAVNPAWDGTVAKATIVINQGLAVGAVDSYTITANAAVAPTATANDRTCTSGSPGGFRNNAHVGFSQPGRAAGVEGLVQEADQLPGGQFDATACSEPVSPAITKVVAGVRADAGIGGWIVDYDVTVANPSGTTALVYSLSDTLGYPTSVSITAVSVSGVDKSGAAIAILAGWNGVTTTAIVANRGLPANRTDVYRVEVRVTVQAGAPAVAVTCASSGAGHGLFNGATAVSGADSVRASACADVSPPPAVSPLAYTGVDATGMSRTALLLLLAGALMLASGTIGRRTPRRR